MKKKTIGKLACAVALSLALYGYAYAKSVVIVLGDDFYVIPIGESAPSESQVINYEYDALGRLVEVGNVGGPTQEFNLDAAGNRTVIRIF